MAKKVSKAWRAAVERLVRAVRAVKDGARGVTWRRLHGIESQLSTVAGLKSAIPSKERKAKAKKKKKKDAKKT